MGHHIEHRCNGGETRLGKLVLLCRHHHRLVHDGGFDCRKNQASETCFVDQRQRRIEEAERVKPVTIAESLAWMYRRFDKCQLDSRALGFDPRC